MRVPADKEALNRGSPVEEDGEAGAASGDTRGGGTFPGTGGGSEGIEDTGDAGAVLRKGTPTSTISCKPKFE
ncbi:MAG: hypothetical protein HN627_09870 [Opitutae bacterium]|nr:hypothetical protein [Opitutae bacterium]